MNHFINQIWNKTTCFLKQYWKLITDHSKLIHFVVNDFQDSPCFFKFRSIHPFFKQSKLFFTFSHLEFNHIPAVRQLTTLFIQFCLYFSEFIFHASHFCTLSTFLFKNLIQESFQFLNLSFSKIAQIIKVCQIIFDTLHFLHGNCIFNISQHGCNLLQI